MNLRFLIFLALALGAIFVVGRFFTANRAVESYQDREKVEITIGSVDLTVEVVKSEASLVQGLSDRAEIGSDGMLFILQEKSKPVFWMKNMLFDIDIIWIDGDKIVAVNENVTKPEPGQSLAELELISPGSAADKVLELNAGDAQKYKLEVGDRVVFK